MSGASLFQTFRRITFKLAIPAIAALFILIFMRAFESFETPALVGLPGNIALLTADIYRAINAESPPNYGEASAFSVALMAIVAVLLAGYGRFSQHAEKFQTITGKGFRARILDLGKWRYVTAGVLAVLLSFVIVVVAPVAIVVWASLLPFYQPFSARALGAVGLDNFQNLARCRPVAQHGREFHDDSPASGLMRAVVCGVTALFARRWQQCAAIVARGCSDQLATAPLIFPSIVLGVALLQLFLNSPVADLRRDVVADLRVDVALPALRHALFLCRRPANPY